MEWDGTGMGRWRRARLRASVITVRRRLGGRIRLGVGAWREEAIGSWGRGVGTGRGRGGFPEGRGGRPRGFREDCARQG